MNSFSSGRLQLLLHKYPTPSSSYSLLLFILSSPQQLQQCPPLHKYTLTLSSSHILRPIQICRSRPWDSNAESFRTHKFDFNFDSNSQNNNNDDYDDDDDDDDNGNDEDDDDTVSDMDQWVEVLDEFIEGVWIFKAFRSLGWTLPAFIASLLLATGPKAFLMALAVPLGQSALSLAFQKLWGKKKSNPKRKAKKKQQARAKRKVLLDEVKYNEGESQWAGKRNMGYKSWVAGNEVPADKDGQYGPSLGGWDELDKRTDFNMRSKRSSRTAGGQRRKRIKKGKMSRRGRRSETPLLLRLLIAVLPLLGSWTKML